MLIAGSSPGRLRSETVCPFRRSAGTAYAARAIVASECFVRRFSVIFDRFFLRLVLRIQWGNPCRFNSCLSHLLITKGLAAFRCKSFVSSGVYFSGKSVAPLRLHCCSRVLPVFSFCRSAMALAGASREQTRRIKLVIRRCERRTLATGGSRAGAFARGWQE